jgi:hypothetical protein
LNTDQLLADSYRQLDPVEGQDLGVRVQINEFGVSNGGRMTSAHFNHHLLARFHFIQPGKNHIRQRPPLDLIGGEQGIHSFHIAWVNLLLEVR